MITEELIEHEIVNFKADLAGSTSKEVVQKRILFGECLMLNRDAYYSLRSKVSQYFNTHPNEVMVVGSAKLGFSIAPNKSFRPFSDQSDIDVVVVSSSLFDQVWKSVFHLWKEKVLWEQEKDFKKYLFRGWIRPDKLPSSQKFPIIKDWWEFFQGLTSSNEYGPYKIAGAIYKDLDYLTSYQDFAVQFCKDKLQ